MTFRQLIAFAALSCGVAPGSLAGQQRLPTVRVASCAAGDSVLGRLASDGSVIGGYDSLSGGTHFITEPERRFRPGAGIREVGGSLRYEGRHPAAFPPVQLDFRVLDPVERALEQRQLRLVLDDSLSFDLGSLTSRVQQGGSSGLVWQNMAAMLSPSQFVALVRAQTVRGSIGQTTFVLTATQHRKLRALYVAAVCVPPST